MALSTVLTWNEALSGICGSISLASWIFLLVPQLIENYRLSSASGISLIFLSVWLVGDITNLLGATWAGLVPTVIALAIYFCIADFVLISQCLYYNYLDARRLERSRATSQTIVNSPPISEHDPLLSQSPSQSQSQSQSQDSPTLERQISQSSLGLPGSQRRRRSSALRSDRESILTRALEQIVEDNPENEGESWIRNAISVLVIIVIGMVGWFLAYQSGVWRPQPPEGQVRVELTDGQYAIGAQLFGYSSAICYLGARIPQIIKNQREKSCEGLSLLFFILSLMGNASYGAGILFHSIDSKYVLKNLPWLIGSIGTMAEDAVIFIQFHAFQRSVNRRVDISEETVETVI